MKTYLHVGTDNISRILFRQVKIGYSLVKPVGGLWLTKYEMSDEYNAWVSYISEHPHILYYKGIEDLTNIPCCLVTIDDNCHTFYLDSDDNLTYLKNKYGIKNTFNWPKLSQDYDAIDISFKNTYHNPELAKLMKDYCLSSFILFNPNMIKSYVPGKIMALDIYGDGYFDDYHFTFSNDEQKLDPLDGNYVILLNQVMEYVHNFLKSKGLTDMSYSKTSRLFTEIEKCVLEHYQDALEKMAHDNNVPTLKLTRTLIENALI